MKNLTSRFLAPVILILCDSPLLTPPTLADTVTWTNTSGGLWSAGTNWSAGTAPRVSDDVFITVAGNYTVTQDVHATVASLTLGGDSGTQKLANAWANLTLNEASTVNAIAVLELGGGTLAGAGALTVAGKLVWTGGTVSSTVIVTMDGTLDIGGSGTKSLTGVGTLINHGTVVWSGPNDIETANSARILNQPGALFDIQNNQSLSIWNGGAITNLGTIRKSAGGATTLITVPLFNFGGLDVQSGVVAYGGGSQFNDGTAFAGAGTNLVYAGTVAFNGTISSENLEIGGATFGGDSFFAGVVKWTSGTLSSGVFTVATNGTLHISGSIGKEMNGTATLSNLGRIVWSGTNDIETANYARIINQAGARFDIQNDQSLKIWNGGAITNLGTIRKSAGGATTLITVPLFNFGGLDAQSGVVAYAGGSQFNDGTAFAGAGTNLVYTGSVSFNGAISSENLEIGGATFGGDSLFSGVVNWTSGTLSSGEFTVATNGALYITGSAMKYLGGTGTLINYGSIAWSGTNDIQTANEARIINQPGAVFDVQNDQSLTIWNGGAITNLGTIRKSAGGATTLITVPLYNSGTLDAQSGLIAYGPGCQFNEGTSFTGAGTNLVYGGTVFFNGAISSENLEIGGATFGGDSLFSGVVNWTGGTIPDNSTFAIATNGALHIGGSAMKYLGGTGTLINYGSIAWSGSNDIQTFNSARIINQPGALFDVQNNQSLTIWNGGAVTNLGTLRKTAGGGNTLITVPFYNSGTVDLQNGTITFRDYAQTGGKLAFGLNSLTNFGRLAFARDVVFTGTLAVNLNGGYVPVAGDSFALITYPSRAGAFAGFDLPASHAWQTDPSIYGPIVLTLGVLNARPILSAITDRTTDEQVELAFPISGSDPDPGQRLSYSLLDPPNGATINSSTGYFSWTPGESQGPSTNVLFVQVTDNGTPSLTATQSFTVVVNEVNRAPSLLVPATQRLDEMTTLTVTHSAVDPDIPPNSFRYTLVAAPDGVDLNTTTGVLTWTPTEAQGPGMYTLTVAVTDSGIPSLSATNTFTVVVNEVNRAPSILVPTIQTVDEMTTLTVTNSALDPDLPPNSFRYILVAAPDGVELNTTTGVLTWTPTEAQGPATNTITVAVIDNGTPQLSATNSFEVVIREVNRPPELSPLEDCTHVAGGVYWITNSASDPDVPAQSLSFSLLNAPPGMSIGPTTGLILWAPPSDSAPLTNSVTARVADNGSPAFTAETTFIATLVPVPRLYIRPAGMGSVVLSWPAKANAAGFVLQYTTNLLSPGAWMRAEGMPVVISGGSFLTNDATANLGAYRLASPSSPLP